ncbi:DUF2388 domain-containing protein [Lysobacter xanthus]
MNRSLLAAAIALSLPLAAHASSFAGSSAGASSAGGSNTTGSSTGDDKIVLQAREDAAMFVATDGRVRSAQLEGALRLMRTRQATAGASDLQLAMAILAR